MKPNEKIISLINMAYPEPRQLLGQAAHKVNRIDFKSLVEVGINIDPTKWDFVHYYPLLGSLPVFEGGDTMFDEEEADDSPIALYFHIPFCTGLCIYCYYMKYEKANERIVDEYLDYLNKEISLVPEKVRSRSIHSIMIGGGTPTFLNEKQLVRLFRILSDNFNIKDGIEISLEASPETITIEKLQLLKELGVNRVSLGIQSFDDNILRKINRRHTSGDALASVYKINKSGFSNYNIDVMYGLPEQNMEQLCRDMDIVREIKPPSICFYQLWFSPEKPFGPSLPIDFLPKHFFLDINTVFTMKVLIREFMNSLGYHQDQICWHIRSEHERCKQQVFRWENNSYLGFGLSSYGYYNGWSYSNFESLNDYYKSIDEGSPPIKKGKRLSRREEIRRAFVLGLKLTEGIDTYSFQKRYGVNSLSPFLEKIKELRSLALLRLNSRIELTETGKLFDDEVCRQFF